MGRKENIKRMKLLRARKQEREYQDEINQMVRNSSAKLANEMAYLNQRIVKNTGPVKYSDLLRKLIEPYLHECTNFREAKNLIHGGALAWNLAVMKNALSPEDFRKTIDNCNIKINGADASPVLQDLMARKESLFWQYNVLIARVEVTENKKYYGISIAVSPLP